MSNELQHIIDSKRELLRRETVLRSPINYSAAMPSDQKDRYIRYLIESQEEKDLELRSMRMAVEMAAAYHSVISTVKLHGMSSWHYLGELFQKIFNGCRDFLSMTPQNIGLAYSKC